MNKEERKKILGGERPAIEIYINGKPFLIAGEAPLGFTMYSPNLDFAVEFRELTKKEKKELAEVEKTFNDQPQEEETQIC